jgi:hypothetical protein
MDKENVIHTHTQKYYSTMIKNEILSFAAKWMELEDIILSEIKHRHRKTSTTYVKSQACNPGYSGGSQFKLNLGQKLARPQLQPIKS